MIAITQRDLPYLVLSEDPKLQAYRTDRISEVAPICPAETGDLFCDAVTDEGVLALDPIEGSAGSNSGTGASSGLDGAGRPRARVRRRRPRHPPAQPRPR